MNSIVLFQSSLIPLLLITSCLLSINLQSSLCAAETVEFANCSQPIICEGVNSSISYPFWGANRADYCGKSGFQVTCQDTDPMIRMGSMDFRILNMSASGAATPTVTVAREDYWNNICPLNYVATNINFSLLTYASGVQNVSFFYGCSSLVTTQFPVNSQACNSTVTTSYVTQTQAAKIPVDPVESRTCTNKVLVPVSGTASQALDSNTTDIKTAIDGGFELDVLNDDTGHCNNCVASGGVCGQNITTNAPFMCFCENSSSTNTTCTGNSITNPNSSSGINPSTLSLIFIYIYLSYKKY